MLWLDLQVTLTVSLNRNKIYWVIKVYDLVTFIILLRNYGIGQHFFNFWIKAKHVSEKVVKVGDLANFPDYTDRDYSSIDVTIVYN